MPVTSAGPRSRAVPASSLVSPPVVEPRESPAPAPTGRPSLDTLGATASIVCAVHCVAVALLLGAMPALGLLADPRIEWGFLFLSTGVGVLALVPAYGHHHRVAPLLAFAAGILVLATAHAIAPVTAWLEVALVVAGASCLVLAHWTNRRLVTAHTCVVPGHRH